MKGIKNISSNMGENEVPTAIIINKTPLELDRIICCLDNPINRINPKGTPYFTKYRRNELEYLTLSLLVKSIPSAIPFN